MDVWSVRVDNWTFNDSNHDRSYVLTKGCSLWMFLMWTGKQILNFKNISFAKDFSGVYIMFNTLSEILTVNSSILSCFSSSCLVKSCQEPDSIDEQAAIRRPTEGKRILL